jgi:hypothetical protein
MKDDNHVYLRCRALLRGFGTRPGDKSRSLGNTVPSSCSHPKSEHTKLKPRCHLFSMHLNRRRPCRIGHCRLRVAGAVPAHSEPLRIVRGRLLAVPDYRRRCCRRFDRLRQTLILTAASVCLTIGAVAVQLPTYVGSPTGGAARGHQLRIITANLEEGQADPDSLVGDSSATRTFSLSKNSPQRRSTASPPPA